MTAMVLLLTELKAFFPGGSIKQINVSNLPLICCHFLVILVLNSALKNLAILVVMVVLI